MIGKLIMLSLLFTGCAAKQAGPYRICQAVIVSCSSGQCSAGQALKDVNTGLFVSPNQCDEVR